MNHFRHLLKLAFILALIPSVSAEQFGLFTYEVYDGKITITDYPEDATGHVEIPAEIKGLPVVSIIGPNFGDGTFSGCTGLITVSIPDSVTSISDKVFSECSNLISIEVDALNANYSSLDGALFNKSRTRLLRYPAGRSGAYALPEGVTHIQECAFSGCSALSSVNIPASVTNIGEGAFYGCTALTSIEVDELNSSFSSLDGVLFNRTKTTLILYPADKSGAYTVPDSVTSINSHSLFVGTIRRVHSGPGAFEGSKKLPRISFPTGVTSIGAETFRGCSALTTVTIPASITFIGNTGAGRSGGVSSEPDDTQYPLGAFEDCTSLHSVIFLGDAPENFDENTFTNTAPDFTIYYLSTSTGFTSPTWNGYPTVMIDEATYPAAPWLVALGLPQDTDLNQDLNGDGISLLMAYALDLDPNQNLRGEMPAPVLVDDSLTLTFHAAAPGMTYSVETSTDLNSWTKEGVTLSELDPNNHRTASVPLDAPQRFLRLVVSD